jgi:uncharacterized membrane protein
MRPRRTGLLPVLAILLALLAWPAVAQEQPAPGPDDSPAPAASSAAEPAAGYDPFAVIPIEVEEDEGPLDKVARDPLGNGIAILVLLLLGISLIAAPLLAMRGSLPHFPSWIALALALVGMAVAAYLASIESSGSEAVCGPVGDCNAVQESEYAQLFGIHIGLLGLAGYGLIGALWIASRVARGRTADWALVLIALGAIVGVAFSTYLTFLEPFVIGATCLWCITSALVMLALLWVSVGPGYAAWQRLRGTSGDDTRAGAAAG